MANPPSIMSAHSKTDRPAADHVSREIGDFGDDSLRVVNSNGACSCPSVPCSSLPVGTRIRFLKTLNEGPSDEYPARHYATKGELGTVAEGQYPCREGHWVFWDGWKYAPFGATLGEDFEVYPENDLLAIAEWMTGNHTGTSSKYMLAVALCGKPINQRFGDSTIPVWHPRYRTPTANRLPRGCQHRTCSLAARNHHRS